MSHSGAFSSGMNTSDTKSKGIADAFTMAGAAFAFGITVVIAKPKYAADRGYKSITGESNSVK